MESSVLQKILDAIDQTGKSASHTAYGGASVAARAVAGVTEYVGCAAGDTVGIVIANLDPSLRERLGIREPCRSVGVVSSRVGSMPQIMAADDAVKSTNARLVSVELSRDGKGGAGQGCTIMFEAADVSDARKAIEILLARVEYCYKDVCRCDAGHVETHYTARAGEVIAKVFGAAAGRAFGITVGAPAAVGLLMADAAVKTADVSIVSYRSPSDGGCFSNEIITAFSGDAAAVSQAVASACDVGLSILRCMGYDPAPVLKA